MKTINTRTTKYEIDDIFLKRHSTRALSGEMISQEELMTLFEVARWAPSSRNEQPWRFLYAMRNTENFNLFFSFLVESNQTWCKNASALVIVLSKKIENKGDISLTHSLDAGLACENLLLQAVSSNLVAHAMGGFHKEMIREKLLIPEIYEIETIIAIGKLGKIEDLSEKLQEREKPSQRKNIEEIVFEGNLPAKML